MHNTRPVVINKPKASEGEYVLELRFTNIGVRAQPLFRITGRNGRRIRHNNEDATAADLQRFMADWTSYIRNALRRKVVPQIDAKIMAEVKTFAAQHHLTIRQAQDKMGLPHFRLRRTAGGRAA